MIVENEGSSVLDRIYLWTTGLFSMIKLGCATIAFEQQLREL